MYKNRFNTIMLDKISLEKLKLYQELQTYQENIYSIHFISTMQKMSYSKLKQLLTELSVDLKTIDKDTYPLLTSTNQIFIHSWMPNTESYYLYLIKKSIPYLFLVECLLNQVSTLQEFSTKYFISSSTVRRRLVNLNDYLHTMDLQINFSKMKLIGDERLIRITFLLFLWLGDRGKHPQLQHFQTEETEKLSSVTRLSPYHNYPTAQSMTRHYAEIAAQRIKGKHFVTDSPKYDTLLQSNLSPNYSECISILEVPKEKQFAEARFLAWLSFYGPSFYYENDLLFHSLEESLQKEGSIGYLFNSKVLTPLLTELFGSKKMIKKQVIRMNMVNIFFSYAVFQCNTPTFSSLTCTFLYKDNPLFQELCHTIKKRLSALSKHRHFFWMNRCLAELTQSFAILLFPEYERLERKYVLHVSILYESSFTFFQKLDTFLAGIPFVDNHPFDETELDTIDFVISSSEALAENIDPDKVIVFPFPNDQKYLYELLGELSTLYSKKIKRPLLEPLVT